jgi:hypothetical protein
LTFASSYTPSASSLWSVGWSYAVCPMMSCGRVARTRANTARMTRNVTSELSLHAASAS